MALFTRDPVLLLLLFTLVFLFLLLGVGDAPTRRALWRLLLLLGWLVPRAGGCCCCCCYCCCCLLLLPLLVPLLLLVTVATASATTPLRWWWLLIIYHYSYSCSLHSLLWSDTAGSFSSAAASQSKVITRWPLLHRYCTQTMIILTDVHWPFNTDIPFKPSSRPLIWVFKALLPPLTVWEASRGL